MHAVEQYNQGNPERDFGQHVSAGDQVLLTSLRFQQRFGLRKKPLPANTVMQQSAS